MAPHIAAHQRSIEDMQKDQESQSKAIERVADKVDSLKTWLLGALLTSSLSLLGIILNLALRK
jgi:hypothetical protein